MRMTTDDELYEVDSVFLGPPGFTFPWRARYQAYGVWAALMVSHLAILKAVEMVGFWGVIYGLCGTVWITRRIGEKLTYQKGVAEFLAEFWAEIRAPRPAPEPAPATTVPTLRIRRRPCL